MRNFVSDDGSLSFTAATALTGGRFYRSGGLVGIIAATVASTRAQGGACARRSASTCPPPASTGAIVPRSGKSASIGMTAMSWKSSTANDVRPESVSFSAFSRIDCSTMAVEDSARMNPTASATRQSKPDTAATPYMPSAARALVPDATVLSRERIAALLARLARQVVSIERLRPLHEKALALLAPLNLMQLRLVYGDGMRGHPPNAPYDSIIAAAGGEALPPAWLEQLAVGGRLVAPLQEPRTSRQVLVVVDRHEAGYEHSVHEAVKFVPLKSGLGN